MKKDKLDTFYRVGIALMLSFVIIVAVGKVDSHFNLQALQKDSARTTVPTPHPHPRNRTRSDAGPKACQPHGRNY